MNDYRTAAVGFGAGLLGAVVGVVALGAAPKTLIPAKLEAKEFVVRDDRNQRRVMLGTRGDDARVVVYDGEGNERAVMVVEKAGAASFSLPGVQSKGVGLTMKPDGTGGVGAIGEGSDLAVIGLVKGGVAAFQIHNSLGEVLIGPVGIHNNSVKITDREDKPLFKSND